LIYICIVYIFVLTKRITVMKNQYIYLEHANITVNDINKAINFFKTAFPNFYIRGGDNSGREWVHLGNDYFYVALNQATQKGNRFIKNYERIGINHIAFVVDDIKGVCDRLIKQGYKRDYPTEIEDFRTREYFADDDGNEFEFIEYSSDIVTERNEF
jgi:catechol 2,3-dioxygenase-like lactoylglutathione lyase family enzyme